MTLTWFLGRAWEYIPNSQLPVWPMPCLADALFGQCPIPCLANAPFPIPNSQFPMPHAPFPMPHSQLPITD
ncbi:hypothetical protein QUB57_24280 [Microcoleus sp. F6_C1]